MTLIVGEPLNLSPEQRAALPPLPPAGDEPATVGVCDAVVTSPEDLKPLGNQIVLEMIKTAEKTEGGIILSERQQKTITWQGLVLVVGPGKLLADGSRAQMTVMVGDKVHYSAYAGTEINRGGK